MGAGPTLDVLVLERERIPREHVGKSQLPSISPILDEMGVGDPLQAAGNRLSLIHI